MLPTRNYKRVERKCFVHLVVHRVVDPSALPTRNICIVSKTNSEE